MKKCRLPLVLLLVVITAAATTAWSQTTGQPPASVAPSVALARGAGQTVTVSDLRVLLGAQSEDVKQRILANPRQLEELVKSETELKVVLAEARRQGVDKRSDVVFLMKRAQEQAIVSAYLAPSRALPEGYPTDAEVADYYAKNKTRFTIPEQVNLSTVFLLLLPAWAGDKTIEAKVQAEAVSITAQARTGANFAELARRYSQDRPTASTGGLVGWVTAEQLVPELAQVAFRLKPGEVSDPIRTQLGFQVVRVNDRTQAIQRSLPEARAEAVALLQQEYRNRKEREVIDGLLKQSPVSVESSVLERWRLEELRVQR